MPSVKDVEEELIEEGYIGWCNHCKELIRESDVVCPRCRRNPQS